MLRNDDLAAYFLALAHPVRLAIVEAIIQNNNCVGEAALDIPNVSLYTYGVHFRALRRAGVIKSIVLKNKQYYCLDCDKLETFKTLFDELYYRVNRNAEELESCIKNQ